MRPPVRHAALLLALLFLSSPLAAAQVRIVVLGSSTAAGTGPSQMDSAWVNRYRTYLRGLDPQNELINLARGGYTTYHILPTAMPRTEGRPSADPDRNIERALSANPDAILINMPSNDAARGYTIEEQLANYDAILEAAGDVPVWISTTQPRALSADGRANLMAVRDSTLQRFGDHALDFWTGIATEGGALPGSSSPSTTRATGSTSTTPPTASSSSGSATPT